MADNYSGFKFSNVVVVEEEDTDVFKSIGIAGGETYTGFIINSGDDLKFSSAPAFSDEFTNPKLGDNSIYTGTTVTSKSFNFRIALKENTYAEFQSVLKWLGAEQVGYLIFDYNDNFGHRVKVASIGEASYVVQSNGLYNIEFDVSFITTGDWAAYELDITTVPTVPALYVYPYKIGVGYSDVKTSFSFTWALDNITVTMENKAKVDQYFTIDFNSDISIGITSVLNPSKDENILVVTRGVDTSPCRYYSQYGIAIDIGTGEFVSGTIVACAIEPDETIVATATAAVIDSITILAREII